MREGRSSGVQPAPNATQAIVLDQLLSAQGRVATGNTGRGGVPCVAPPTRCGAEPSRNNSHTGIVARPVRDKALPAVKTLGAQQGRADNSWTRPSPSPRGRSESAREGRCCQGRGPRKLSQSKSAQNMPESPNFSSATLTSGATDH